MSWMSTLEHFVEFRSKWGHPSVTIIIVSNLIAHSNGLFYISYYRQLATFEICSKSQNLTARIKNLPEITSLYILFNDKCNSSVFIIFSISGSLHKFPFFIIRAQFKETSKDPVGLILHSLTPFGGIVSMPHLTPTSDGTFLFPSFPKNNAAGTNIHNTDASNVKIFINFVNTQEIVLVLVLSKKIYIVKKVHPEFFHDLEGLFDM